MLIDVLDIELTVQNPATERCTRCGKLQRDVDLDKSDNTCESHIRSLYCEGLRQTDDDAGSKP